MTIICCEAFENIFCKITFAFLIVEVQYIVIILVQLKHIEGFCMWTMCFDINWLLPNITHLVLKIWSLLFLKELYIFSFIKLLSIFFLVFMPFLPVINSKIYKSNYPNTIWWIILLLWVNYENNTNTNKSLIKK